MNKIERAMLTNAIMNDLRNYPDGRVYPDGITDRLRLFITANIPAIEIIEEPNGSVRLRMKPPAEMINVKNVTITLNEGHEK